MLTRQCSVTSTSAVPAPHWGTSMVAKAKGSRERARAHSEETKLFITGRPDKKLCVCKSGRNGVRIQAWRADDNIYIFMQTGTRTNRSAVVRGSSSHSPAHK